MLPKNTKVILPGARVRVSFGPPVAVGGRELNAVIAEVRQFIVAHVTEPQD